MAAIVADAAPDALRQFVDSAEGEEVFCTISRRMLPPTAPVSVIAYRDPHAPGPIVHLQYADACLQESAVIERPGLREEMARAAASERELAWCTLHNQQVAGIAFQAWTRFYGAFIDGGVDPRDVDRVALEQRGWRPPLDGLVLPADAGARLTMRPGELVLSFPEAQAFTFQIGEQAVADHWLQTVRGRQQAIVLYGCGVAGRLPEALRLGDVVGASVPFADETRRPRRPSRWR